MSLTLSPPANSDSKESVTHLSSSSSSSSSFTTQYSSKKTTSTTSHLVTPPRSASSTTPSSPIDHHDKSLLINNHIITASKFISSTWHNSDVNSPLCTTSTSTTPQSFARYLTEILRRSRCSISALNAALFYISKLTPKIQARNDDNNLALACPKKVFLICLELSFKFQYDSTYNLKAWSKISGLSVAELKSLEMKVLQMLDYDLALNKKEYMDWLEQVDSLINSKESMAIAMATTTSESSIGLTNDVTNGVKRSRDETNDHIVKKIRISCA